MAVTQPAGFTNTGQTDPGVLQYLQSETSPDNPIKVAQVVAEQARPSTLSGKLSIMAEGLPEGRPVLEIETFRDAYWAREPKEDPETGRLDFTEVREWQPQVLEEAPAAGFSKEQVAGATAGTNPVRHHTADRREQEHRDRDRRTDDAER